MRALADEDRIRRFMRELGAASSRPARVNLTGGATAVLLGWRTSTIDVDLKMVPEHDELFRAIPRLKESLAINVELAAPSDFIPVREDWEARSPSIGVEGRTAFHHFDLTAQALAKVERGHAQDVADVREMVNRGLVTPAGAWAYFDAIEPRLYRYPALDPATFRAAMRHAFGEPPA
jgi:hypothetical protein